MLNSDRFEREIAAAGLTVNDIDYVMCTHLHGDHVGWNTRLDNGRWVPTFPNAKYIMADGELAYWSQRAKDNPASAPWMTDSVLPIVAAKREQIVKSDFIFNEQVQFIPTPPHRRPFLGIGRPHRRRRPYHRRHDPFAAAGKISRARHDGRLRLQASRTNATQDVRPFLRGAHHLIRKPFSDALDRAGAAQGRRL
jgi:hypothetical protein